MPSTAFILLGLFGIAGFAGAFIYAGVYNIGADEPHAELVTMTLEHERERHHAITREISFRWPISAIPNASPPARLLFGDAHRLTPRPRGSRNPRLANDTTGRPLTWSLSSLKPVRQAGMLKIDDPVAAAQMFF
ncbi:MAG: hypothetical protein H0W65_02740 [Sphingomonas sp.]|uniref:hypothetical protein n=1 Tax=Sphingomonas sp. TaxID=28214 RepID=UPI001817FC33|nr:hypothetical protein [Sphingomonas sp.]MBA3666625.1 hypothetical protein [Sphingomonas sp.]